jgi:GT2 family glycosyltransferase
MSRIAAVIVNFRTADATLRAASALAASERPIDRLILVDNGSGDDSADRLRSAFPGARLVETGANLGFAGGTNRGIEAAIEGGADLVLLVNSDAELEPGCLGALEAALAARSQLGLVGPALVAPDRRIESLGLRWSPLSGRVRNRGAGRPADTLAPLSSPRVVDGVSGCVMLIRRRLLDATGGFDERYFYALEDLDLCLRAREKGFGTACVETARAHHEGSATIGARSPRRLYFATRNHLLLAKGAPLLPPLGVLRSASIVAQHLAQAIITAPAPRLAGLAAVARGIFDHLRRRYGPG